jgi:hypothetical protein
MRTGLLTFFILLLIPNIKAQEKEFLLPDSFCFSYGAGKPYLKGAVIKVECDTVYLINKLRYKRYEAARKALIKSGSNKNYQALEDKYLQALKEQDQYYRQLLLSYSKSDSLTTQLFSSTKTDLANISNTLSATRKILEDSDKKLEEVEKILKGERRKARKEKLAMGFGGLGIGILIGVLVH